LGALSRLYERYRSEVEFLGVYVREAHPEDGWVLAENRRAGVAVRDPRSTEERVACATRVALQIPFVVDRVDDEVARRYGGWPERLYLIGCDGRIAYQGGPGPDGFVVAELDVAIERSQARAA
jgi:Iodothyronine deiodinase